MKLKLLREIFLPDRTIGRLWFGGHYVYTLEDAYREQIGVPVEQWKIDGKTAIPSSEYAGKEYSVIVDFSNRFGREMPHILDVPGFTGVRIHSGNTPDDTHGCVLVGTSVSNSRLVDSRSAYNLVMDMIEDAYEKNDTITLSIEGLPPVGADALSKAA